MAKMEGFHFEDTLTGFKYIGNKALDLENEGYSVDLLYEEAIGYGISPFIRDKDGITAAIAFVRFAAHLKERSMTPYSHLQHLFNKYGHYHTRNDYFKCSDNNIKAKIFKQLREVQTVSRSIHSKIIMYINFVNSHQMDIQLNLVHLK